jgi:thioredoxin reductase (NADPH)
MYDAAIIGGGPAGLTAALYLARYHLSVYLADSGNSRAGLIPKSHNQLGYLEGISGRQMLERMRAHVKRYPVEIEDVRISEIGRTGDIFEIRTCGARVLAKSVLLATGVENRRPEMTPADHDTALASGLLRYCPICDGFEVTDQEIAIVGSGDRLYGEALFLRSYTGNITAASEDGDLKLSDDQRRQLEGFGIKIVESSISGYCLASSKIEISFSDRPRDFDTLYPALGSDIRSGLAKTLGAELTDEGCVVVDRHQRTTVSGLYAAGDVVFGVDQISHAAGQATVAATALRNDLSAKSPLLR